MRSVHVEIEGVAPLRFNQMGKTARAAWISGKGSGRPPTEEELEESWKEKLYVDAKGIYVPSKWIKASIRNAGSLVRVGRKSIYEWIKAVIFPNEEKIYTGNKKPDGVHEDIVRRPPKKGTIQRDRWPILATGWKLNFDLNITDETFPISALEEATHLAGLRYGLGDGRPDFGRFRVKKFEENGTK